MPRRRSAAVDRVRAALAAAAWALVLAAVPAATLAATVPSGFTDSTVASGLSSPTAMELAPDGRIFVAEQGGKLRVIKNGALLAAPFVTVPTVANGERGFIGVTLDPDFATNGYVYVYYTVSGTPAHNRVSRFTASAGNPDVAGPTETILVDLDNLSSATNHNGGALRFGSDGKLYVAVGENANGANAQTLGNRLGKMLRYNADGSIPTDNPFYTTATGANRAIWARGLRNPYTFAFQPETGRMMINDVGEVTWEELDVGAAGANYGWPSSEGATNCTTTGFTCPLYSYPHTQGCAVTGGAFYNPATASFPASYVGKYFFSDYCGDWIKLVDPDAPPATGAATTFASNVPAPVDLRVGPDGSLYYLARDAGSVGRIQSTSAQPPSITQHPSPKTVPVGTSATFSCSASGSAPLAYRWQRDRGDIAGATSSSYTLMNAQPGDSGALFRCAATNAFGEAFSNEALLTVTTNTPPTPTIVAPAVDAHYNAGQTISYGGSASDGQDPSIPPANFTWEVVFHHDTHTHPFVPPTSGATGGTFTIPNTGETATNVWYRIHLTVRDSGGLTGTTTRDVLPNVATLNLATNPAGLPLTLDAQPVASPASVGSVAGMQRAIGAPLQAVSGGKTWQFSSWSDGGARNHTITTPGAGGSYTATFVEVPSANVALAALGGVATASSSFSTDFAPGGANDGDTTGAGWGDNAGWNDATGGSWPDWLQVAFDGAKTIDRVVVYTLQDNFASPSPPTDAMTFTQYGVTAFQVQYWTGSAWSTLSTVSGNNLVKRTVTFPPVTTDRIRVNVTAALQSFSRIIELEAWTPGIATTTTTLASSVNPSTTGQAVTFTATVSGNAPTGAVAFRDGASTIAGCSAAALSGSGNSRTAACTTSSLAQGTRSITAAYAGNASNAASTSSVLSQVVNAAGSPVNVARAANGGVATASSQLAGYPPASAIDGDPLGDWGSDGGWNDATGATFPDWLQVAFNGPKTIDRVVVYTLQDAFASPSPPTDALTFTQYGITAFQVQSWTGSAWTTLATVNGNNLVKRTVTFAPVTTDRIRILVTNALLSYSRITEVEAWGTGGSPPAPTTTTLASSLNPSTAGQAVTFTATVAGTAPTGTVAFRDGASEIAGCSAVALSGSGNSRTAACTTSSLAQGTRSITAAYSGNAANAASTSSALSQVVNAGASINVALASNGGVASASSQLAGFSAASAIDGDPLGDWGSDGGWNDATGATFPDWLQVTFNGQKTVGRVVVYTLQDDFASPSPPTDALTFTQYGVTSFQVQAWSGSRWVTQATVGGNNLVKRTVTFAPVTTNRIRINVTGALASFSRITEVEAWTP